MDLVNFGGLRWRFRIWFFFFNAVLESNVSNIELSELFGAHRVLCGELNSQIRAACLQNETAPKSFNFKTKNGPKNDPKLPRKILSLVLLCRISHRHYSKIFHREFPHKIKYFFTT